MALRKLGEAWPEPCRSPQHNPPAHVSLPSGVYEWTCSACGNRIVFCVRGARMEHKA